MIREASVSARGQTMRRWKGGSVGVVSLACALALAAGGAGAGPERFPKPAPNSPDEPLAKTASTAAAARFLDNAAVNWTESRKCATCHTNVPYLMARPAIKEDPEGLKLVRQFFEGRVKNWDNDAKRDRPRSDAEVVATAAALAFDDAQTTGKLHPLTRKALDRMWARQGPAGAWNWDKCTWPPFEHDDYYGAALAALAAGIAPEGYARGESAREGLAKLKDYLRKEPAPTLHHKAWLLWASMRLDGLMTKAQRDQTVKELLARQRDDGGWSLPSLGDWKGFDGRPNDVSAPADGYGTGLVVYVLRQAGVPGEDGAVRRGVAWLKAHQRASGRWFTRSLNTDRSHYISHAGTAFALMALKACEE
jgi:squalene-hopene/tetraprenyl-beta-curcumene cyclase